MHSVPHPTAAHICVRWLLRLLLLLLALRLRLLLSGGSFLLRRVARLRSVHLVHCFCFE